MKRFVLCLALGLGSLTACGGDDDGGGSGGSSGSGASGGSGGASSGGSAGSSTGGSSTGGAAGSGTGGSATGGAAGSGTGGSGTGGSGTGGTGGSGTGGSGTGGVGGASACNTLVNDGGDIPETQQTGTPPTMTGGTITNGIWVLTNRKDWQGSCNCTTRQKIEINTTAVQVVTRTDAGADQRFGGTLVAAGKVLTLNVTCPAVQTKALEYTATATELQIYDPSDQSLQTYNKK